MTDFVPTTAPNILVTGGAGYIATHAIVCLIEAGYDITVVDNLINSNPESLSRVKTITGCSEERIRFFEQDLCDKEGLERVFSTSPRFTACLHFAGLKAVGESVAQPLRYYTNNLDGTINLIELMDKYDCHSLVFSSSATVYGSAEVPITENTPTGNGITNPYGRTKYFIEEILSDYKKSKSSADWSIVTLRYFNPVGSHPSGLIGEDPSGPPNNLMPYVAQVAVGRRPILSIFGNDYPTPDGTGVRDYIHVMDLAEGHLAALRFMQPTSEGFNKYSVINLGSGKGYSVLEMVHAMEKASGRSIPYQICPRREGDIAVCYAATEKALLLLGWSAKRSLEDMCTDLWRWQASNPTGYSTSA